MHLNLRIYEKTSEEGNCPDVVVGKEESAHEEGMHEEKSAHAWPKESGSGKPRWSLFSHIDRSFGRDSFDSFFKNKHDKKRVRARQGKVGVEDMPS